MELRERKASEYPHRSITFPFLFAFFNEEYWTRVWIVQEVLLSRELMFQFRSLRISAGLVERCGDLHLDDLGAKGGQDPSAMRDSENFYPVFVKHTPQNAYHSPLNRSRGLRLSRCFFRLRTQLLQLQPEDRFLPFPDALKATAGQECELQHDKIYGLLGLTHTNLIPDYDTTRTHLFLAILGEGFPYYSTDIMPLGTTRTTRDQCEFFYAVWHAFDLLPYDPSVAFLTMHCFKELKHEDITAMGDDLFDKATLEEYRRIAEVYYRRISPPETVDHVQAELFNELRYYEFVCRLIEHMERMRPGGWQPNIEIDVDGKPGSQPGSVMQEGVLRMQESLVAKLLEDENLRREYYAEWPGLQEFIESRR